MAEAAAGRSSREIPSPLLSLRLPSRLKAGPAQESGWGLRVSPAPYHTCPRTHHLYQVLHTRMHSQSSLRVR